MSAKAAAAGSIVVGIIAIIAAIPSGGASLSALATLQTGLAMLGGAAMVGVGIYGLIASPKGNSRGTAKAQDLEYASAADGVPLPVIFGEQRVVGNFMNYTLDNFRNRRIDRGGGKGGDSGPVQTVGFDYYLTYEYGLCMGPIDEIVQVISSPGELLMMGESPTAIVYSSSDVTKEVNLDSIDPLANNGAESGLVRVYRGTATQDRTIAGDPYQFGNVIATGHVKAGYYYKIETQSVVDFTALGAASNAVGTTFKATNTSGNILTVGDSVVEYTGLNYRNICWALFMDFKIGRFPTPKSYHFVLRRFPIHSSGFEMLRPDGTTITGFTVRGSADDTKPAYNQANPAAILYEVLTNKVWGRGLSQDLFHEASWISVASYFASKHIGMSFTIDSTDKIGSVIDWIRSHTKLLMVFDGDLLRLRCLLNLSDTHGAIQTLTPADYSVFRATRPMWGSTVNDIRIEFQNRNKNYKSDSVQVRDVGNYNVTGRRAMERISLNAFNDYNTVRRQGFRILREKAYPLSGYELVMNRFHSQIQVGDVVRVLVGEFETDGTIFMMVTKIEEPDSSSDDIRILGIEDIVLKSRRGTVSPSVPASAPWESIEDVSEGDVGLWTGSPEESPTGNYPFEVIEIPPILAHRLYGVSELGLIALIAQRPVGYHTSLYLYVASSSDGQNHLLSRWIYGFAIAGELTQDYNVNNYLDRQTGFTFTLFDHVKDEAELLSLFSEVDTPAQSIENILTLRGPCCVIQGEIFAIGKVDKLGTNSYRARNLVRGRFGTKIAKRSSGTRVMFMDTLADKIIPLYTDALNRLASGGWNREVFFRSVAIAPRTALSVQMNNNDPMQIYHSTSNHLYDSQDGWFMRESDTPLPMEFVGWVDPGVGLDVYVRIRARNFGGGTNGAFIANELLAQRLSLGNLTFRIYVRETYDDSAEWFQVISDEPIWSFDSETKILTFEGIPEFWKRAPGPLFPTEQTVNIRIETVDAGTAFNGLVSVEDLIINVT